MRIGLSVVSSDGAVRWSGEGEDEVVFGWRGAYDPGDRLLVTAAADAVWLSLQLDSCLAPSLVLLKGGRFTFPVPDAAQQVAYGKGTAFTGERHYARVRVADSRELASWRNLALNAHDLELPEGEEPCLFPHAQTNVPATNPQFYARCAIDGTVVPWRHGSWPHGSWGIGGRSDAALTVSFGAPVLADELRLYLRADFPHDSWWESAVAVLSDGERLALEFGKTGACQRFSLRHRTVSWLRLERFQQAPEPGFPALSQIEVWGRLAEEGNIHA